MIDMSGWASVKDLGTLAFWQWLTRYDGRPGQHSYTLGSDLCQSCGVSAHGPAARLRCPGYMAGP